MLNIAKTIYAAWDITAANQKYELPEAEVIPLGESANEKKKLAKVTQKYPNIAEHDNIPLPGFTLHKTDRRNWGSIDQTWLVIDPRGFLVRISSKNLEDILHVTGITEGLIQQKCVWARDNTETKMILVPVSAKNYTEAVENTEIFENKVDMKDVQIGDTVLLQNTLTGTYMGVASLYGPLNDYSRTADYAPQAFLRRQIIEINPGKYYYQTDLKILKVIKKADVIKTREEAVSEMNHQISIANSYFSSLPQMTGNYYGTSGMIKLVSTGAVPKVSMTFEEIDEVEATNLYNQSYMTSDFGALLLENLKGERFVIDFPYSFSSSASALSSINSFKISKLLPCSLDKTEKISLYDKKRSIFGYNKNLEPTHGLDKFTKYYKIVKHVKNDTYI